MRNKIKTILIIVLNVFNATTVLAQNNILEANGRIYKNHKNIDAQRAMIAAMEDNNFDDAFSYFLDEAAIGTANYGPEAITNSSGSKAYRIKFHTEYFDVLSMDMQRPSLYVENENSKGGNVLSWYVFHLKRKSDKKEIEMPIHFIDSFNKGGKIIAEFAYYSNSLIYIGGKPPQNE